MVTIQTQSGIGLETLPARDRRMEAAAVAVCATGCLATRCVCRSRRGSASTLRRRCGGGLCNEQDENRMV